MSNNKEINKKNNSNCPNCNTAYYIIWDKKTGDIICSNCGEIIEKIINLKPEWTNFDLQHSKNRIGPASSNTMMTKIANTSTNINKTDPESIPTMERIRKIQNETSQTQKTQNYKRILNTIEIIKSKLDLPSKITQTITLIMNSLHNEGWLKGKPSKRTAAAIIYIACRLNNIPINIGTLSKISNTNQKKIWKYTKKIKIVLNAKTKHIDATEYIFSLVSKLKLPDQIAVKAIKLLSIIRKKTNMVAKDPKGIAAAAVYAVIIQDCKNDVTLYRTQKDIAKKMLITEPTIRKRWTQIKKIMEKENKL